MTVGTNYVRWKRYLWHQSFPKGSDEASKLDIIYAVSNTGSTVPGDSVAHFNIRLDGHSG